MDCGGSSGLAQLLELRSVRDEAERAVKVALVELLFKTSTVSESVEMKVQAQGPLAWRNQAAALPNLDGAVASRDEEELA
eukprot:5936318-Pleurochrysis_carterae.AAC.1